MSYQRGGDLEVVRDSGKESIQAHTFPVWQNVPRPDETPISERQGSRNTICGVSRKTFFITVVVAIALIVAAALAGGLGGGLSNKTMSPASASSTSTGAAVSSSLSAIPSSSSTSISTSTSASPAASSSASIYKSDCPTSNGNIYVSTMFASGANGNVPSGAINGLRFQKKCSTDIADYQNLVETEVTSFDACIDLCASYNFWNNVTTCNAVSYTHAGGCWVKYGSHTPTAKSTADSAVLVLE